MTTPLDPGLGLSQPEPAARPTQQRRRPRRGLFVTLIALGVLLIVAGAGALGREMTRAATPAEAAAALQQEIATRWERLPAGKIFPATVSYSDAEGTSMVARLVGIAPRASCQGALGPAGYAAVHGLGCAAILRATYVDGSGALVATVGVAVLRSPAAAQQAWSSVLSLGPVDGLYAVTFAGTTAARFDDTGRGAQGGIAAGPYLLLYTAGFTDGLPGSAAADQQSELDSFGNGVDIGLQHVLTGHGKPCAMKDITC
ncbi:MAG TPA: hypothetical protein VEV45_00795 [Streptosporangiaceae bacterium]|nr:hypothetical protein [Streptosporangiaceae bacterium]